MSEKEDYDPTHHACPDCGGKRAWGQTNIFISIISKSKLLGDKLRPLVCTNCGLTTFYHPKPKEMR